MRKTIHDITIVFNPTVKIVGQTTVNKQEMQEFLLDIGVEDWHSTTDNDAGILAEFSGRVCYGETSFRKPRPGGHEAYMTHIIESGHGSVAAHPNFTLAICGVSRSLTHELIRHHIGTNPSELSQRYVELSDVAFVLPPAMIDWYQSDNQSEYMSRFSRWVDGRIANIQEYKETVEDLKREAPLELTGTDRIKWARQAARNVLPNCAESAIVFTGNLRAWRNIIEQRTDRHADEEIRRLAAMIGTRLKQAAPSFFADYQVNQIPGRADEWTTPHRKI